MPITTTTVFVTILATTHAILFSTHDQTINFPPPRHPHNPRSLPHQLLYEPLPPLNGLQYTNFSHAILNGTSLAVTPFQPSSLSPNANIDANNTNDNDKVTTASLTRHHAKPSIALFDLLSLTWGCGILSYQPVVDAQNVSTGDVPFLAPRACRLSLRAYGGGTPGRDAPLEIVSLEFEPGSREYAEVEKGGGGGGKGLPFGSWYILRDGEVDAEVTGGEKEGITLQHTALFPGFLRGVQTLVFEARALRDADGKGAPGLVLAGMEMRMFRLRGWEYGLGDSRRVEGEL